jgi:membrane-associated phospholipid phosphatase
MVPLAVLIAFHLATFYLTRLVTDGMPHYDFSIPFDRIIPFVPAFIVIYILAYVQWGYGIYYLISHGRDVCFKFISATMIGEVICLLTFLFVPTALVGNVTRPEIVGNDAFSWMTSVIYSLDEPNNLFPSLHCFASWMCFRGIFYIEREKRNRAYTVFSLVFSLLVFASTVFVKQHVVVDIIGGVALVEAAILIEKLTKAHRVLYALDRRLFKNDADAGKEP